MYLLLSFGEGPMADKVVSPDLKASLYNFVDLVQQLILRPKFPKNLQAHFIWHKYHFKILYPCWAGIPFYRYSSCVHRINYSYSGSKQSHVYTDWAEVFFHIQTITSENQRLNILAPECPPAWTQKAYRLQHSKYPILTWLGGTPVIAGTGGGYPILT